MVVLIPRLFSETIKSFFPHKDRLSRSLKSKVVYRASCWDCEDCYIGKTKRRLHDRKTEHFKALTSNSHSSDIADHMTQTGHKIKWDHFDILATGQSDLNCPFQRLTHKLAGNYFPPCFINIHHKLPHAKKAGIFKQKCRVC